MSETKCERNCHNDLPLVIGGILVYELAIIIVLLILILTDLDRDPCTLDTTPGETTSEE